MAEAPAQRGAVPRAVRRLRARPAWGPQDRRGALNYLTPDRLAAACREVRLGRGVSLASPMEDTAGPDNPEPVSHDMTGPAAARQAPVRKTLSANTPRLRRGWTSPWTGSA